MGVRRINGGIIGAVNSPTAEIASGVWSSIEEYNAHIGLTWVGSVPLVEYLVVAGGGGAAYAGAGAGGLASGSITMYYGTAHILTIGAGGAGVSSGVLANNGNNTVFSNITTIGGGGSGYAAAPGGTVGLNGGSGGGGGHGAVGGSAVAIQGNIGGSGGPNSAPYKTGGGGGAGAAGISGAGGTSGAGGIGKQSTITGAAVYYAGGGGGGVYTGGTGGAGTLDTGGGGNGSYTSGSNSGLANTGGGGGGSYTAVSGSGGSGIVILAYPLTYPAITTIGAGLIYTVDTTTRPGYRVYKFTAGTGTISW